MTTSRRGRSTEAIDDFVGGRIRQRRVDLGLTQQQLAVMIGVTYQQAHKYERGINRVSAGRLYEIGQMLNVPITYFYEGLGDRRRQPPELRPRMTIEHTRIFGELNDAGKAAVAQLARTLHDAPIGGDARR